MKQYPNTSILTLITQTEGTKQKLLFLYVRPVPDMYSLKKIHWYDGAGKDGKPNTVWESLFINQWVACGKDEDIIKVFDELLLSRNLTIDGKIIEFILPSFNLVPYSRNVLKGRGDRVFDTLESKHSYFAPKELYQNENLNFLSGYKEGSTEIKPLFPLGFFEENFLYNNFKDGVLGIKEYRTAYLTFHGVQKTSEKGVGSKEMVGFYQQDFSPTSEYTAVVKNEEDIEIGRTAINKKNGFFKISLSEPTKKGKVEVLVDSAEEKSIEYVLLQDIQINTQIASATFNDAYGRHFLISEEKESANPVNFTWQNSVYVDAKTGDQKLSDLFKDIFYYLGPRIVVADPYFIGQVKLDDTTKQISLSRCQIAFINALIHSAIRNRISQVNILGYWSRAKKQVEKDETREGNKIDQLFENYEKAFKKIINSNNLQKYLQPSSVQFLNAKEDFHNRYWFSLKNENGIDVLDKCVTVTNSLGGIIEVDFITISDDIQLQQIIRKHTLLFKDAELKLTI